MKKPNLFDYATSELSQDAFICWLLAWNHTEGEESETAKAFVAFLYNEFMALAEKVDEASLWESGDYSRITSKEVGKLLNDDMPMQQKFKTDVFFVVNIKGQDVAFIIEDKTNTSPHSNQLNKYVEEFKKNNIYKTLPLVRIFYKTGYVYPKDSAPCKEANYSIINAQDALEFLQKNGFEHVIYQDYVDFLKEEYVDRQHNAISDLDSNKTSSLKKEYVKYEFMKTLAEKCADSEAIISHKTETSGSWAQYKFCIVKKKYGDINESLFYRVERLKGGYTLSLRQYAKIKKNKAFTKEKLNRLERYKESFAKAFESITGGEYKTALKDSSKYKLNFKKVMGDKTGANTSQIALLHISNDGERSNTINDIYNELPKLHHHFIKSAKEEGLID